MKSEFKNPKALEAAISQAKEKLQDLQFQLTELDQEIANQPQEASLAESNAQAILSGTKLDDLRTQQSASLRVKQRALQRAIDLQAQSIRKLERQRKIRIRLVRPWADYGVGSKILIGKSKGDSLVKNRSAIEIKIKTTDTHGNYLPDKIVRHKKGETIRIKLRKRWGGFPVGHVFLCGSPKCWNLIDSDIAEEAANEKLTKIAV